MERIPLCSNPYDQRLAQADRWTRLPEAFNEEQLTQMLEIHAKNILHAMDIPTRRRILAAVTERLLRGE